MRRGAFSRKVYPVKNLSRLRIVLEDHFVSRVSTPDAFRVAGQTVRPINLGWKFTNYSEIVGVDKDQPRGSVCEGGDPHKTIVPLNVMNASTTGCRKAINQLPRMDIEFQHSRFVSIRLAEWPELGCAI
jgi:hypothetical protein